MHAEETPVAMLKRGNGKTHWDCHELFSTGMSAMKVAVFDVAEIHVGRHAEQFLD
jgi:hypothetical protein